MFNNVNQFLGHAIQKKRIFENRVANWKDDGTLLTWMHTTQVPTPIWHHQVPMLFVGEDRETKEPIRKVIFQRLVCHEPSDVLEAQNKRDKVTGERVLPPTVCLMCKFVEHIRARVTMEGSLKWTDPVFRFEVPGQKPVVIHAGGVYGAFGQQDLPPEKSAELKKNGIFQSEAWREKMVSACRYVFTVVEHKNPEKGLLYTIESNLLGQAVAKLIRDTMSESVLGPEEGNPYLHPYCVEWVFDKTAKGFQDMYRARRAERFKPTQKILDLLTGPPPDLSELFEKYNPQTVRARLERSCLVEIPWDELCSAAPSPKSAPSNVVPFQRTAEPLTQTRPATTQATSPDEMISCEGCQELIHIKATECPKCHTQYEVVDVPSTAEALATASVSDMDDILHGDNIPF